MVSRSPGISMTLPKSSLGADLRSVERLAFEGGSLRRSRGSSRVSVAPVGPLFGVPEGRKSRFGEPTKDPSSRRCILSLLCSPRWPASERKCVR